MLGMDNPWVDSFGESGSLLAFPVFILYVYPVSVLDSQLFRCLWMNFRYWVRVHLAQRRNLPVLGMKEAYHSGACGQN